VNKKRSDWRAWMGIIVAVLTGVIIFVVFLHNEDFAPNLYLAALMLLIQITMERQKRRK
jgi:hypothetical protein